MSNTTSSPLRRFWTEAEIELLRGKYANSHTADLAAVFNRPVKQVLAKAHALGLHKSLAFIAEVARLRNQAPGHGSKATRFRPGLVPHNKGTRRPAGWAPGDMAKTQFKPGNRPHTWVPVGSYTVNADGHLERKVSDDPGPKHVRWKPVTRLVWEAAHGPIPADRVVVFKPGRHSVDPDLITPDALELITRRQLMQRNTIHNHPPELVELMKLRGQLTRAIDDRTKETTP